MTAEDYHKVIERIPDAPRKAPQCEADVQDATQRWRERNHRDYRCDRPGRYLFKGKALCALHAGNAAVAYLLGEKAL